MPISLGYKAQTKHCTDGQSMTERPSTLCWNIIREYSQKNSRVPNYADSSAKL